MSKVVAKSEKSSKCEAATKLSAGSTPTLAGSTRTPQVSAQQVAHVVAVESEYFDGFYAAMMKAAGFSNKEITYDMRVSPTMVDMWKSGERIDPFTRAREAIESVRRKGRSDLIPSILIYCAGGYDGAILTEQQFEALKVLQTVGK